MDYLKVLSRIGTLALLVTFILNPRWETAVVVIFFALGDIAQAVLESKKAFKAANSELDELRAEIKEAKARTNQLSLKLGFKQ